MNKIGKLLRIANNILVKDFNTRPFTMYVKNNSDGGKLKCVEVGAREGYNARNMLKTLDIEMLVLVDIHFPEKNYKILKKYKNIKREKKSSVEASKLFEDKFFDVIYIDVDPHDYDSTIADITAWHPKLKKNGFMGGHDFDANFGVPEAVIDFCRNKNLKYSGFGCDWWFKSRWRRCDAQA